MKVRFSDSFQADGLTVTTPTLVALVDPNDSKRVVIMRGSLPLMVFALDTEENAKRLADYFGVAPKPVVTKATFPITGEQLKEIFPKTDQSRCDEVADLINKYSDKFEINTPLRMAHFLGQIGWESAQLRAMGETSGEGTCYKKASAGWSIWFSLTWKETPFNADCSDAPENSQSKKRIKKNSWKNISDVPLKYICNGGEVTKAVAGKNLFCYVYRCEGGNGDEASCDGYRYRGHGIMQLTWKKQYDAFNNWLISKGFPSDYGEVSSDPDEGFKNKEIDVLSGMWYWDINNCNKIADIIPSGSSEEEYGQITKKINVRLLENKKRNILFEQSYSILNK